MDNTKIVFSRRIALLLKEKGFPIIGIETNRYNPDYIAFKFEKTPELIKAFDDIVKLK